MTRSKPHLQFIFLSFSHITRIVYGHILNFIAPKLTSSFSDQIEVRVLPYFISVFIILYNILYNFLSNKNTAVTSVDLVHVWNTNQMTIYLCYAREAIWQIGFTTVYDY